MPFLGVFDSQDTFCCTGSIILAIGFIFYLLWSRQSELNSKDFDYRLKGKRFPIYHVSTKQIPGYIWIYDDHLELAIYKSMTEFQHSIRQYFGNLTNANYDWYPIPYGKIKNMEYSPKDTLNIRSIHIFYSNNESTRGVRLDNKYREDGSQIYFALEEHWKKYKRRIELEQALLIKYRAGNFEDIHPHDFEKLVGELFTNMGYLVNHVGGISDGGVDLVCEKDGDKSIIQCKRYKGSVGVGIIRDFYGTLINSGVTSGFLITSGNFTKEAERWARYKPIKLIDKRTLSRWMWDHYK